MVNKKKKKRILPPLNRGDYLSILFCLSLIGLFPVTSHAQVPGVEIWARDPVTGKMNPLEATNGRLKLDWDRDQSFKLQNIMNNTGIAEDACDSTVSLDTRGVKQMSLLFYPRVAATQWSALISIKIAKGYIQAIDTVSAFPWARPTPGTSRDTIGSFTDPTTATQLLAGREALEFLVVAKIRPGGNAQQGVAIDLVDSKSGAWFWADYTYIRACVIETYDANGAAQTGVGTVRWRADLVGRY